MTRIALAPSKMVLLMSLVITGAHASPEQPNKRYALCIWPGL